MDINPRLDCHGLVEESIYDDDWNVGWSGSTAEDSQGWECGETGGGTNSVSGLFIEVGVIAGNLKDNKTLTTLTELTLLIHWHRYVFWQNILSICSLNTILQVGAAHCHPLQLMDLNQALMRRLRLDLNLALTKTCSSWLNLTTTRKRMEKGVIC